MIDKFTTINILNPNGKEIKQKTCNHAISIISCGIVPKNCIYPG